MSTIEIRAERAADVAAVRTVHTEAFGRPDEAVLVAIHASASCAPARWGS